MSYYIFIPSKKFYQAPSKSQGGLSALGHCLELVGGAPVLETDIQTKKHYHPGSRSFPLVPRCSLLLTSRSHVA